jgi:hypothetical protein
MLTHHNIKSETFVNLKASLLSTNKKMKMNNCEDMRLETFHPLTRIRLKQ